MSDEKWELVERQVELLRRIADKSPGVLDLQLSVNTAANTVELLKGIAQHEKRRAEKALAELALLQSYAAYVEPKAEETWWLDTFEEWKRNKGIYPEPE